MDDLLADLQGSRKYGSLDPEALKRTADWALERSKSRKEAAKTARRKLHQVYGAFLPAGGLPGTPDLDGDLEVACRAVLGAHTSTRERLGFMGEFFAAAFSPGDRVVDLGGGLNAFALPWMPRPAAYETVDVDTHMQELVEALAPHVDVPLTARTEDLVSASTRYQADVALLLKVLPPLEMQAPGAAGRLLGRIDAPRIVISVSAHSLGGRKRGMRDRAAAFVPDGAERIEFPSETMFVLSQP